MKGFICPRVILSYRAELGKVLKILAILALAPGAMVGSQATIADEKSPTGETFGAHGDPNGRAAVIVRTVCSTCHESGVERAPPLAILAQLSPRAVYRTLTDGAMRVQASAFSLEEKAQVAEFITNGSLSDEATDPKPPACTGEQANFDYEEPPVYKGWGVDYKNSRLVPSKMAGINKENISRLKLKWAFGFPGAIRVRSEPAFAGGAIYTGSNDGNVYALDRKTGCLRWEFQAAAEVRTGMAFSIWKSGEKAAQPIIYFGDLIGNFYALDAVTGKLKWKVHLDQHPSTLSTGSPVWYDGKVFVGVSSQENAIMDEKYECCTFRGSLVAFDGETGKQIWRRYTIDSQAVESGKNGLGGKVFAASGASVWNAPTIDESRNLLYFGTGNSYSSPAAKTSDSVFAVDIKTGEVKWTFQARAGDAWNAACIWGSPKLCPQENGPDYDFGSSPILAKASDGREMVVAGSKSGIVYSLDPDTGKLIWKSRVGRGGITGGVHFGMAVSGDKVFVPINDLYDGRKYETEPRSGLHAISLLDGSAIWDAPSNSSKTCLGKDKCEGGVSVAITATPDLVFAGENDGWFRIYDSESGKVLWRYDTTLKVATTANSEAHGGSMGGAAGAILYDGTMVVPSGYGLLRTMPGNVMLVFGVDDSQVAVSKHQ